MTWSPRVLALAFVALSLVGCGSASEMAASIIPAAEYHPMPTFFSSDIAPSGYSEERIDAETWKVRASGTTVSHPARVALIGQPRAAEIGKQNGYGYFRIMERAEKLQCSSRRGQPTLSGIANVEYTVKYAKAAAPDFTAADAVVAENMPKLKGTPSTPENRAQAHSFMMRLCDIQRGVR